MALEEDESLHSYGSYVRFPWILRWMYYKPMRMSLQSHVGYSSLYTLAIQYFNTNEHLKRRQDGKWLHASFFVSCEPRKWWEDPLKCQFKIGKKKLFIKSSFIGNYLCENNLIYQVQIFLILVEIFLYCIIRGFVPLGVEPRY